MAFTRRQIKADYNSKPCLDAPKAIIQGIRKPNEINARVFI